MQASHTVIRVLATRNLVWKERVYISLVVLLLFLVAEVVEGNSIRRGPQMSSIDDRVLQLIDKFVHNDDIGLLRAAIDEIDEIEQPAKPEEEQAKTFRERKLQLLLAVINGIDEKRIPNFDFDDAPALSPPPPPETGLPSGVGPESVKDPVLRSKFEKEIAANAKKAKVYNFQSDLRQLDELTVGNLREHVEIYYTRRAKELAEAEALIDSTIKLGTRKIMLKQMIICPAED